MSTHHSSRRRTEAPLPGLPRRCTRGSGSIEHSGVIVAERARRASTFRARCASSVACAARVSRVRVSMRSRCARGASRRCRGIRVSRSRALQSCSHTFGVSSLLSSLLLRNISVRTAWLSHRFRTETLTRVSLSTQCRVVPITFGVRSTRYRSRRRGTRWKWAGWPESVGARHAPHIAGLIDARESEARTGTVTAPRTGTVPLSLQSAWLRRLRESSSSGRAQRSPRRRARDGARRCVVTVHRRADTLNALRRLLSARGATSTGTPVSVRCRDTSRDSVLRHSA
jgi:hypothetical protein